MNKILLGIIIVFLSTPYFLDKFIMKKIVTTMGADVWFGFLGSYLGGGLTALITLYGIYWQLSTTHEKERKGTIKFIKYKLSKNSNLKFPYEIFYNYYDLNTKKIIYKFDNNFLSQNINLIFSLNKGSDIAEIIEYIDEYNQLYLEYIDNCCKSSERFKILPRLIDENNIESSEKERWKKIVKIWRQISDLLDIHIYKFDRYFRNDEELRLDNYEILNRAFNKNLQNLKNQLEILFESDFEHMIKKISDDYKELYEISILCKEDLMPLSYEEYLINLFNLEKNIHKESIMMLVDVNMTSEYSDYFFNENKKYIEFIELKTNLLLKRMILLEKIKIILSKEDELKK